MARPIGGSQGGQAPGKAQLEVRELSFHYPYETDATLKDISLSVGMGEFVVLCGPTGSGKTTLLRHLKRELEPVGRRQGEVLFGGKPLADYEARELSQRIGMVMQHPENQIVVDQVRHELVFGLENMAVSPQTMRTRVAEMAHFFGLGPWLHKGTHELSGGQQQVLNLASVLLLQPQVLLLDEPTAQLDPVAAREFLQMVRRLNEEFAMTVIMTEHRLEEAFPLADRVVMMERGAIAFAGPPREAAHAAWEARGGTAWRDYVPSVAQLALAAGERTASQRMAAAPETADSALPPLSVKDARRWLAQHAPQSAAAGAGAGAPGSAQPPQAAAEQRPVLLRCREACFQYDKAEPLVLDHLSLEVRQGDYAALLGGNGTGKSTLLQVLAGLLKPQKGSVDWRGTPLGKMKEADRFRVTGYLAQNPLLYFAHDTVQEELQHAAERTGYAAPAEEAERMLAYFGLESHRAKHPYDLSGGERQLAALATVLLAKPQALLLDEPTKGLDPTAKRRLADKLDDLHRQGMTMFVVTHDVEFAARHASRCLMMFEGAITADAAPQPFFGDNYFYTTSVNRLVRHWLPQALTVEDVLKRWKTGTAAEGE